MKKQNYYLFIFTFILLSLWWVMYSYADNFWWRQNWEIWKPWQNSNFSWHWEWRHEWGNSWLENQIEWLIDDNWLSDEQKTNYESLIETYKTSKKSIFDSYSWAISSWDRQTMFESIKTIDIELLKNIEWYISSDKQDEYTELLEKIKNSQYQEFKEKENIKWFWNQQKQNIKNSVDESQSFKYIKWNTYTLVEKKLESFSQENLISLLEKLDTIISNTTNSTQLWIYNELKIMIENKI